MDIALKIAKEIYMATKIAMEFNTEKEKRQYQKDHDVRPTTKLEVKDHQDNPKIKDELTNKLKEKMQNEKYLELAKYPEQNRPQMNYMADQAANTQRGVPESTMLDVVKVMNKYGSSTGILTHYLEHLGDLSHRAQEEDGIGMQGLEEKISMVHRGLNRGKGWMPLEDDIAGQIKNNDVHYRRDPSESANVRKRQLEKYVKAHEDYNMPVTYMGKLGKEIAIAFGKQDYNELKRLVPQIKDEFDKWSNADSWEEKELIRLSPVKYIGH